MNINIRKVDIKLSKQQESKYLEKILDICRFLKGVCPLGTGELELGRITSHHQSGPVYSTKVRLEFPGKDFFLEEDAESLDSAFNVMKDKLEEEVRRYKDRLLSDRKKNGQAARELKEYK